LWPGGGTVFGPQPRDYRLEIPRKVKQLARKSALNARAAEGNLFVVERFEQQSPKTRELVALLEKLGVGDRKVLVLTHGVSEALYLSARNLPRVDVLPFSDASAYDVIWAEVVVVEEPALAGEPAVPFVRSFTPVTRTAPAVRAPRVAKPKTEKPKSEKAVKAEKKKSDKAEKTAAKAAKAAKPKAEKKAAKPKAVKKAAPKAKTVKKAAPKKKGGK
jgi:hypothetical protein